MRLPDGETRAIGRGLLIYLGVGVGDGPEEIRRLAKKALELRVFPGDGRGRFDLSVQDIRGDILVVSQFTLYAGLNSGRRPEFSGSAGPMEALPLYRAFVDDLEASGLKILTGEFGAAMVVDSSNEGPATFWLDSREL